MLLFVKGETYRYIYVFEWIQVKKYTFEGSLDVKQPFTSEYSEFIIPNPQHDFDIEKSDYLLEVVTKQFPDTKDNQIIKVIERDFPNVKRFIITIRVDTRKLEYVLHDRNGDLQII